jgi:fructose-1,6-bisphosphatase/sedoheptulose 1,7-bisphosphatase-like protein
MAKLKIVKFGDPILRKVSRPVEEITPRILTLLDDMTDTMREAGGCGLAAVSALPAGDDRAGALQSCCQQSGKGMLAGTGRSAEQVTVRTAPGLKGGGELLLQVRIS